jgi:hypothetical protein
MKTEVLRFTGYFATFYMFRCFWTGSNGGTFKTADGALAGDTATFGMCMLVLVAFGIWRAAVAAVRALKRA